MKKFFFVVLTLLFLAIHPFTSLLAPHFYADQKEQFPPPCSPSEPSVDVEFDTIA